MKIKQKLGQRLYIKEEKLHEHNAPPDESLIYMIVPKVINRIYMFVVLGINMYQKNCMIFVDTCTCLDSIFPCITVGILSPKNIIPFVFLIMKMFVLFGIFQT